MLPNLVVIGDIAYETIIIGSKKHTCLGGSAYYALIGAKASKNNNCILIASVGEDFNFDALNDLGILDVNIVSRKKTANFITEFVNDIVERKFYADFGAIEFPQYELIEKYLDKPLVFLAGSNPMRQLCWIEKLKSNNYTGIIACDVFEKYCLENREETVEVIDESNIVFVNQVEAKILNYNPIGNNKTSIIKKGEAGATLVYKGEYLYDIKPQIEGLPIDTNGAGDILAASFLSKIIGGCTSYTDALQFAVDLASLSVFQKGVDHIL
ncbi:carbohydrate kinase family protein [Ruminococcus sp.]|uniref:carbohydrate kinase family protein n=1 Tax=Ruminococcus sp. TaxID=41978 RepID=UPI002E79D142|nr:PfkB family carbohydrate kinase [Ruminococcus sp.]MEE0023264.1 PfkB family carbohydrate kinase [Ruminococcus sp.]